MNTRITAAALLAVGAFAVVGCSGPGQSESGGDKPGSAPAGSASVPGEAASASAGSTGTADPDGSNGSTTSAGSSSGTGTGVPKAAASAASSTPDNARPADGKAAPGHSAAKAAGIPPEPSGPKRARLLHDLSAVSPNIVKYEDKAVAAARNQCSSINGGGARLDHTAAQRFSYKDVKTTEAQGRQINQALRSSGFCKV